MRYLVIIGAMMLTASPAFACYTVKFENKSDATVGVGWKAGGCLKVWQNFAVVCTHHVIGPGHSKSYDYPWGTTAPAIVVLVPGTEGHEFSDGYATYNLHGSEFGRNKPSDYIPASAPKCHKHYTITYTQSDYDKDRVDLQ